MASKKPRRLTPQELGLHEMRQVYQHLMNQMDLVFGDNEDLDEDNLSEEQQHILLDIMALEEEWIIDPIKRAKLSVIQTEDS